MLALNSSGAILWNISLGSEVSSPAYRGAIYAGTIGGEVYAIATNGTVIWNATVGGPVQGGAVVAGDQVIVATNQANSSIYFLSAGNGSIAKEYSDGNLSYLLASPVIYDSMLVIASGSGRVLFLGTPANSLGNATISNAYLGERILVRVKAPQALQAYLYYRNSTNSGFIAVRMSYDSSTGEYVGYIPPQNSPCTIQYHAVIYGEDGSTSETPTEETTVSQPVPEMNPATVLVFAIAALVVLARRKL